MVVLVQRAVVVGPLLAVKVATVDLVFLAAVLAEEHQVKTQAWQAMEFTLAVVVEEQTQTLLQEEAI
jgi:hypothetical protein